MKKNKKGFTIVELVIVIAVIGILSAILIPTFIGLTKNANEVKLQENLNGAYEAYAVTETEAEKPASYELLDRNKVVMATALIDADGVTLYMYKEVSEGKVAWAEVTKQETGTYTLLNAEAYNGYYAYKYTPAQQQGD